MDKDSVGEDLAKQLSSLIFKKQNNHCDELWPCLSFLKHVGVVINVGVAG